MNTPHPRQNEALAAVPPPTPQYRKPPLTLGRLAYLFYFAPKAALKKGPLKMLRGSMGRRRMCTQLPRLKLPSAVNVDQAPLPLHALIGAKYIPEACLLSSSLSLSTNGPVQPIFYDDGTLSNHDCDFLAEKLPLAQFRRHEEICQKLEEQLPENRFPCLRKLRPAYPHIRKLTDVHLFPEEWKLVSDADILFFAQPRVMLDYIAQPRAFHMVDIAPAYGVPHQDLEDLAETTVHPKINVGLCHLPSAAIDWDFVEYCAADLLARRGFTYYLEQALTAILLARLKAAPLPAEDYVVYPDLAIARSAEAAAIHYVDDSRAFYYDFAWQQVIQPST